MLQTPPPLLDIYQRLLDRFGPRNWWPGESPYEIILGAVLTQNTNWHNVERAITNLRNAGALVPEVLRDLPDARLKDMIRPAGFYNQKAPRLQAVTRWWLTLPKDRSGITSEQRAELLDINGIGPETADSILLYALERPVFVVDSYTRRVFSRMGIVSEATTYAGLQAIFSDNLAEDVPLFNDFHAQIVMLAKEHCSVRPRCMKCPIRELCSLGNNNNS